MGEIREGSPRNMYKGPTDKAKGSSIEGGRSEWVEGGKVVAVKWRQLYLNNNNNRKKKYLVTLEVDLQPPTK